MEFGKRNAAQNVPASERRAATRPRSQRRLYLLGIAGAFVLPVALIFAAFPDLRSWSWWGGPHYRDTFWSMGFVGILLMSHLFSRRRGSARRRNSGDRGGDEPGSIDLPDWCTDYTDSGSSGDCGGSGDSGGDGGGD